MNEILTALSRLRMPAMPEEYDIHAAIAAALAEAGIAFTHEAKLAPRCRIDFLVGRVGIEVKKGRPVPRRLREQLGRYCESELLDAVIVVTEQALRLPETIGGKRVVLCSLNRLWGVALP